jgi:hypothetical protein
LQWRFTAGRDDGRALRVEQPSYILTAAWNWLGEKTIHSMHANGSDLDLPIVEKQWELLDEADILIAHNNDRFDEPKANTRFFYYGLGPPSPSQTIDTLKVARSKFAHHSNTLDALTQLAGTERKKSHSGIDLWFRCMNGEAAALKEMVAYNKSGVFACTNCGSQDLSPRGWYRTRVNKFKQYLCNNCGKWPHDRRGESQRDPDERIMLT